MTKKKRIEIPKTVAAQVQFDSDRTCCVCRERGEPIQIHHIDENPANNVPTNLAVLCFNCHRETQIKGGFDRKLDADQVTLYRNDWLRIVKLRRTEEFAYDTGRGITGPNVALANAQAEALRDNQEYELLASFYHASGNNELRDKYVELALERKTDDYTIVYLRGLQGKPDKIPQDVLTREESRLADAEDWYQRGRMYWRLDRRVDAARDYLRGINESLDENRLFSAAYYSKEFEKHNLRDSLFIAALEEAKERGDLWWQIRALQELNWHDDLRALVEENRDEIEASGQLKLLEVLARTDGDQQKLIAVRTQMAEGTRRLGGGVVAIKAIETKPEDAAARPAKNE